MEQQRLTNQTRNYIRIRKTDSFPKCSSVKLFTMSTWSKIAKEIRTILRTATYFAVVFILMMVMKKLYLIDYDIEFTGVSQALIGALILSKVVLLMEMISLGHWVQRQPAIVDVTLRTLLYTAGVWLVTILEKSLEKRHEAGGFGPALSFLFSHRDIYHIWATTIGVTGSIFVYNAFTVIQRMLGKRALTKIFFHTPLERVEHASLSNKNLSFELNN